MVTISAALSLTKLLPKYHHWSLPTSLLRCHPSQQSLTLYVKKLKRRKKTSVKNSDWRKVESAKNGIRKNPASGHAWTPLPAKCVAQQWIKTVHKKIASDLPPFLIERLPEILDSRELDRIEDYKSEKLKQQREIETFRAQHNWQLAESRQEFREQLSDKILLVLNAVSQEEAYLEPIVC